MILALTIVQGDGVTTVTVFAHICTPSVFDDGGCTAIDCSATANIQDPSSAN